MMQNLPLAIDVADVTISQGEHGFRIQQGDRYVDQMGKDETLWTVVCILSGTPLPYGGMKTQDEYERMEQRRFRRLMEGRHLTHIHPRAATLADMAWRYGGPDFLKASELYASLLKFNSPTDGVAA